MPPAGCVKGRPMCTGPAIDFLGHIDQFSVRAELFPAAQVVRAQNAEIDTAPR
jgi:hypothetical protein